MPITIIPSFLFFCFVEGITPGPANLGSLNASMQYGKKTALRQWRGLFTGFFVDAMEAVLINYFLGASFSNYVKYLSWIGAAYIVWLAIKILFSKPPALFLVGCFLPFTGPICNLGWLFTGDALRHIFRKYWKQLNIVMAVSLIACAATLVI